MSSLLALALLTIVVIGSWWVGGGGEFAGTDATATQALADTGVEPWSTPLVDLGSSELESGLFALQAGLGGVGFGYALGVLRMRRRTARGTGTNP